MQLTKDLETETNLKRTNPVTNQNKKLRKLKKKNRQNDCLKKHNQKNRIKSFS